MAVEPSSEQTRVPFSLLFKSVVGCSAALLALSGVALPRLFGVETTPPVEGATALVGAVLGIILALKS